MTTTATSSISKNAITSPRFSLRRGVFAPLALTAALSLGALGVAGAGHHTPFAAGAQVATVSTAASSAVAAGVSESVTYTSVIAGRARNS
ncbi:hypothetical protein JT358_01120 [Micrococcales bacterium 31B]|nr:hypothetical protein [Micrococcales bacterium 31B]